MWTRSAFALALLLVTAGCVGAADGPAASPPRDLPATDGPTDPSAPTPDASVPPGVTPGEADEVDERALYAGHARALSGRSVTWREQRLRTDADGAVLGWTTRTVRIDGAHQRYDVATGGADPAAAGMRVTTPEYWTNGSVVASRTGRNGSGAVQVREGGPVNGAANVGTGRIVIALAGVDLGYVGRERRNGTDRHVLAGTSDDARLTLRVTSEGVVRSFVSRTRGTVDGRGIETVTLFRTYDVGSTAVERPAWSTHGASGNDSGGGVTTDAPSLGGTPRSDPGRPSADR